MGVELSELTRRKRNMLGVKAGTHFLLRNGPWSCGRRVKALELQQADKDSQICVFSCCCFRYSLFRVCARIFMPALVAAALPPSTDATVPPHPTSLLSRPTSTHKTYKMEEKDISLCRQRRQIFEMLRRLIFVPAVPFVRDVRPIYSSVIAPLALFSTTSRPPSKDMQTPPSVRVVVSDDNTSTSSIEDKRLTGDEVQKAFDPLGDDGRSRGGGRQRLGQHGDGSAHRPRGTYCGGGRRS